MRFRNTSSGASVLKCLEDGNFGPPRMPTCERESCGAPPMVEHASFDTVSVAGELRWTRVLACETNAVAVDNWIAVLYMDVLGHILTVASGRNALQKRLMPALTLAYYAFAGTLSYAILRNSRTNIWFFRFSGALRFWGCCHVHLWRRLRVPVHYAGQRHHLRRRWKLDPGQTRSVSSRFMRKPSDVRPRHRVWQWLHVRRGCHLHLRVWIQCCWTNWTDMHITQVSGLDCHRLTSLRSKCSAAFYAVQVFHVIQGADCWKSVEQPIWLMGLQTILFVEWLGPVRFHVVMVRRVFDLYVFNLA